MFQVFSIFSMILQFYTLFHGELLGCAGMKFQKEPPAHPSRCTSLSLCIWNQAVEFLYVHIAFNTVKVGIKVSPVGLPLPPSDCFCS